MQLAQKGLCVSGNTAIDSTRFDCGFVVTFHISIPCYFGICLTQAGSRHGKVSVCDNEAVNPRLAKGHRRHGASRARSICASPHRQGIASACGAEATGKWRCCWRSLSVRLRSWTQSADSRSDIHTQPIVDTYPNVVRERTARERGIAAGRRSRVQIMFADSRAIALSQIAHASLTMRTQIAAMGCNLYIYRV
jgi:hypothetical protein